MQSEKKHGPDNTTEVQVQAAFQPIVDLNDNSVYAYEALARGPAGQSANWVFSCLAAEGIPALDHRIRIQAMRSAKSLAMQSRLSVNLSPQTTGCLSASIRSTLRAAEHEKFPMDQLIFEISEWEPVNRPERLKEFVALYRDFGFKTAFDDFGEGFCNWKLLSAFRPDIIKLDMHFTRQAPHDRRSRTVIRWMASTARDLGCEVIAEGVETLDESDALLDLGIHRQQGYLFAFPQVGRLPDVHWPVGKRQNTEQARSRWDISL